MGWFYSYAADRQIEVAGLCTSRNWRTEFNLSSEARVTGLLDWVYIDPFTGIVHLRRRL